MAFENISLSHALFVTFTIRVNAKSAHKVLPSWVRRESAESMHQCISREIRKSDPTGEKVMASTPRVWFPDVTSQLMREGYTLANASYHELHDTPTGILKLVFTLGTKQKFLPTEERKIREDLRQFFWENLWSAEIFQNPHYVQGEENPHACVVNICLAKREPLFRPDGQPVKEWKKDECGQRLGAEPACLMPNVVGKIGNDELFFESVEKAPVE